MDINIIAANIGDPTKLPFPYAKHEWEEVFHEMIVHTRGVPPGEILTKRRPNEDPDVQRYREDIYEPITKGSIDRAIDKLYRIFISANFSISVSQELNEYLSTKKFRNQYFYSYIQKYVVRRMIEDPNGYLAWIPSGPGVVDPTVTVEVEPVLVESKNIRFMDFETFTWLSSEKSEIMNGNKMEYGGEVYYTLTPFKFYRHTQTGVKSRKQFETVEVYTHNIGELPIIVLGGDLYDDDYFKSYFSPFLPFANEAIRQYSDWQGVMTTSCFPYREEQAETCAAPGCREGYVYKADEDEPRPCHKCNGTGRVIVRSPYGVFMREKGDMLNPTQGSANDPMIRFISPDVAIIKESREAWELLLNRAERALCLDFIDEAQSGVAKEYDREDSFMVLTKISNNVFDEIIYKSLLYIEAYRKIVERTQPIIVKPISFSMKTEDDLITELNKLNDKNAPVAFMVEATKDLARKRFSGNKSVARMVEILVTYDPIYNMSTKDKQVLTATGVIKNEDILRSIFAYRVLNTLVSQAGTQYLENEMQKIFTDMDVEMNKIFDLYRTTPVLPVQ